MPVDANRTSEEVAVDVEAVALEAMAKVGTSDIPTMFGRSIARCWLMVVVWGLRLACPLSLSHTRSAPIIRRRGDGQPRRQLRPSLPHRALINLVL